MTSLVLTIKISLDLSKTSFSGVRTIHNFPRSLAVKGKREDGNLFLPQGETRACFLCSKKLLFESS
jgi:hypothetical protein